jgi:hypothetical protein
LTTDAQPAAERLGVEERIAVEKQLIAEEQIAGKKLADEVLIAEQLTAE